MNVLETIIAKKRIEVDERKKSTPIAELERFKLFSKSVPVLKEFLLRDDKTGIIAEFKRRSPSKGIINDQSTVKEVTGAYTDHGASALSILTDESFFGGSLDDLLEAGVNNIPILRKDFIVDEYQLIESKAFGADIILLIAACLTQQEVRTLASAAKKLGLNVLLEIHNEEELHHICDGVDVVGVNNRDLKSFTVDLQRSIQLAESIPGNVVKISESGIDSVDDIILLRKHGFKGFLMGEKFMKSKNPGASFAAFAESLKNSG